MAFPGNGQWSEKATGLFLRRLFIRLRRVGQRALLARFDFRFPGIADNHLHRRLFCRALSPGSNAKKAAMKMIVGNTWKAKIIFIAAFFAVLYHLGVMQIIIRGAAKK